jgi:hypothetical protein
MQPTKTRLTLNLKRKYSFFFSKERGEGLAVCNAFVSKVLGTPFENLLSEVKVSFASKNPKEKNWKKIKLDGRYVFFKNSSFPLCPQEAWFLNDMRVQEFFWLKIEVLG